MTFYYKSTESLKQTLQDIIRVNWHPILPQNEKSVGRPRVTHPLKSPAFVYSIPTVCQVEYSLFCFSLQAPVSATDIPVGVVSS